MPHPSGSTTKYGLAYALETDIPDVATALQDLAQGVENIIATAYQGLASAIPTAGKSGRHYYATDTGVLSYDNGSTWSPINATVATHAYAVTGLLQVPSGATGYLPPFHEPVLSGNVKTLVSVTYGIRAGTSVTFAVTQNGSAVAGLGALVAGTSTTTTAPSTIPTVSNGDAFAVVVSAVSGSPDGLSVSMNFQTVA